MTTQSDLVARLAQHRTLRDAPNEELVWLAEHGEVRLFGKGDLLAPYQPEMFESLAVMLSGHFAIYVDHGAGAHKVMEWSAGDVTGVLPYSRMSKPIGTMLVDQPIEAFVLHRRHFHELACKCPTVTTTLVHAMLDRAREFRSSELQDEKMKSLGKLAAGLAHELNNPASAAARSAKLLVEETARGEQAARALGAQRLTAAQLAVVDSLRQVCAFSPAGALTPVERSEREEAIADWLAAHGGNASEAGSLAETAVTIEGLDRLAAMLEADALTAALRWVSAGCTTRALASEVERAASRISKLVGAVKRFAYMDRALAPEPVDVGASLNDSIMLLQHKARQKSAGMSLDVEPGLPSVLAMGGDLNQVWTNLIDNALDAVPPSGRVRISAARHPSGRRVVVKVIDNGSGIPPQIRDRIFDPFVTSKPVGEGTGLGLDIARQLVRRNNGDIDVQSEPGHTEFSVSLPIAVEGAEANAAARGEA
jgi:signal transduction histidine kinase